MLAVGSRVNVGYEKGTIVKYADDGEVKIKLDGETGSGMYYPVTAFFEAFYDEVELDLK